MPTQQHERSPLARLLRNIGGALLVLVGLAGLVLPFVQGLLLIALGLYLIDVPQKQKAHRWLLRFRWYRWLAGRVEAVRARWQQWRHGGKRSGGA